MLVIIFLLIAVKVIKQYVFFNSENSISRFSFLVKRKCRVELNNVKVYEANLIEAD